MSQPNVASNEPENRGPLVLVVDDSEDILDVYHLLLVQAGYRVATAPDGGMALLVAQELRPSVVILDMVMPEVSGLEFLERLPKEVSPPLPPVIVNSGRDELRQPALDLGAAVFVVKPVEAHILLAAIEMVLGALAPTEDLLKQQAESVVRASQQTIAARELLLDSVDCFNPDFHEHLEALVVWLTGFFGYGMASIDVLTKGKIHVVCAHGDRFPKTGTVVAKDLSFSTDVIAGESKLLLGDTKLQPSFAQHPAARRGYRFYAGVPLRTSKGVIGSLSLGDHLPHIFHGEDMTVLEHVALGIARHTEALATGHPVPALFDQPGLFQRSTFQLLLGTAFQAAKRDRGVIELALLQLATTDVQSARTCASAIYQSIERTGLAVSSYAPGVVAMLKYGRDLGRVSASVDTAIAACTTAAASLRGAGIVRYDATGGPLESESEFERVADETRARAAAEGRGQVERVILRPAPPPGGRT